MSLDHLWAGWRTTYIDSLTDDPDCDAGDASTAASATAPHLGVSPPPAGEGSLFERILTLPDDEAFVVHRGPRASVLLNAYPYTSGHALVLPNRAVPELTDLDEAEHTQLWSMVRDTVTAVRAAYRCEGVNVGINLGLAGGAGVPDHLHVHVLPRWLGDTNFMTAVALTRVMPEPLDVTWRKLTAAWPVRPRTE